MNFNNSAYFTDGEKTGELVFFGCPPAAKRIPCFDRNTLFVHIFHYFLFLVIRMYLVLYECRGI